MRRVFLNAMETMSQRRIIDVQREDLETFAFALAHDIKQPLRQIWTFSDLLLAEDEPDQTPESAMFLRFIRSASGRLTNLIDTMLDYAVLNQPVSLEDVDLGAVAREVCLSLNDYVKEREGRVDLQTDCTLVANRSLLAQILQNLITNGLKYNRSPVPTVSIHVTVQDGLCRITVQDNGIGIEQQYLSDIFKPLRRLHSHYQFSGTGLGLAIVRKAVMVQNGSISCRSEPGKGATFIVTLPQAEGVALQSAA
jgi:signal transduction histidine kinase